MSNPKHSRLRNTAVKIPAAAGPGNKQPLPTGDHAEKTFRVFVFLLLTAVTTAYANHFFNAFHFDDFHTIVNNSYIRSLANIPRFFTDATTFSSLPSNQSYRPLVTTTLAIDYVLGGGGIFFFHLSTFLLFLVQGVVMYLLFVPLFDHAERNPRNSFVALGGGRLVPPPPRQRRNHQLHHRPLRFPFDAVPPGGLRDIHLLGFRKTPLPLFHSPGAELSCQTDRGDLLPAAPRLHLPVRGNRRYRDCSVWEFPEKEPPPPSPPACCS